MIKLSQLSNDKFAYNFPFIKKKRSWSIVFSCSYSPYYRTINKKRYEHK